MQSNQYYVCYYKNSRTKKVPVLDYLRELRVDFGRNRHRVFYVLIEGKRIILLHAFFKKTKKTPRQEIIRALNNFEDYKINKKFVKHEETK